jgi:YidC/Oxa1 family membrane protein insertase
MFDLLVIDPMTNALLVLYEFLGQHFVLAIVVFTILVRLITLPLNLRQQKTSMRMQEMQPQVQKIQKKYKDNPAKMQEEFKKIGYNPTESLSGCLPTLIQFPILIGLYRAIIILLGSTPLALFGLTGRIYEPVNELINVGAALPVPNKFLWLNLAQPDPYYILPVLVFVTMFAQQRLMSPAKKKEDDKGKKKKDESPIAGMTQSMQYTMPVMFAFFSLTFASGLSIYFIFSGLIGMVQSYVTRNAMQREKEQRSTSEIPKTTGIPAEAKVSAGSGSNGRSSGTSKRKSAKRRRSRRK